MNDKDTKDLSIEASINYLSSKDSNGLSNIFALSGSSSSSTSVQFSLSERKAAFINEIGVFVVSDDKGTVNGIAPGQEGYMQAAFTQSRVIFSSLSEKASAGINFVRQLSFKAGERLGFYMVADNTTSSVDTTSAKTSENVFFSLSACNSDKFDHVRVKDKGKNTFDLAWEDLKGGGDKDFNDLVLKMEIVKTPPALGSGLQGGKEGEIIDLRSVKGQISANFTLNSDSNRNHVGFYRINDAQGTVTDPLTGKTITPGEVGYAQAAIRQSIVSFNQSSTSSTSIEAGGLFATYIIANGNSEQFLSLNQSNQEGSKPVAYFTYHKANPDKLQHIRQFGDNTFGFEQPSIKGKREFNYTVFKVDLSVKTEIDIDIDKGSENTNSQVGTLAFAAANYSDFEGNSGMVDKIVAKIQRTAGSDGAASVQVQLDDGSTATSDDYSNLPLTINFADGETSKDVVIPILGDTTDEMDETIKLKLFNATGGASLGSQQTATYTIINDDTLVNISATNATVTETASATNTSTFRISRTGSTSAELAVNLDIDSSSTVTSNTGGAFAVDYSLSGGNISGTGATRSVIIPVGQTFVDVTLTTINDIHAEADEIFKLNLAAGGYSINTTNNNATVTIAANDTEVIVTNDSGEGSLRQALINANAFAGTDNITFKIPNTDTGYKADTGMYTITLASVLDNISDDVNITGLGANKLTVSGNNAVGVFYIDSGKTVNLDGLTIANGKANEGGGIYNDGILTVTNSTITGNSASGTGIAYTDTDGLGGGIYNEGTLTVINSTISGNEADYTGVGAGGYGGGIYNKGSLTVTNSTIADNEAKLTSGSYGGWGGGIYNEGTVRVTVSNSTLSGNSANEGGGIYIEDGTLTVTNSTLSGNSANEGGGGISNYDGTLTVTNSTLSGNSAAGGGGILNYGTVKAKNTIIAKNTATFDPDFDGRLTSQGYNLIGIYSGTGTAATGDIFGTSNAPVDPKLSPLANNGGSTQTMALLSGSPAINAGDPTVTSSTDTDQRGENRVKKGRIDIGAYESDLTPPVT